MNDSIIDYFIRILDGIDFDKVNRHIEEAYCLKVLIENPNLRAVETDNVRAVTLRSGNVQVVYEGEDTAVKTIPADDVQEARDNIDKLGRFGDSL